MEGMLGFGPNIAVALRFGKLQGRPRYMCVCAAAELRAGLGPLPKESYNTPKKNELQEVD